MNFISDDWAKSYSHHCCCNRI